MGRRFHCGVLSMVLASGAALAQAQELETEPPTAEPAVEEANDAAAGDNADNEGADTEAADNEAAADTEAVDPESAVAEPAESLETSETPGQTEMMMEEPAAPRAPMPPAPAGLEFLLRADQPGLLRFVAPGASQEFRAPGRATLPSMNYEVTWVPSNGTPELLEAQWRPNGEAVRVAHRGPSFTNLLGYWLFGNGLLVGLPVSAGVFAKRDDLGAAATFSIIGVNTLVAIAGAILMGVGDDEVIELE